MVMNRHLAFVRADKMSDRFEGTLPAGALASLKDMLSPWMRGDDFDKRARELFPGGFEAGYAKLARAGTYYNCWHMNPAESGAMWAIYGSRGLAIESTVGQLKESMKSHEDHDIHLGPVRYGDVRKQDMFYETQLFHGLYKRQLFDYERELRAAIVFAPKQIAENPPPVINVAIDLPTLIRRVWIGPGQSGWIAKMVEDLLVTFGLPQIAVERSTMDDDPLTMSQEL